MSPPLRHIESSSKLPASADVVVIGGGIIGTFTAYFLAQRGLSVAVIEKGRIGAEQSSRNWGWCRQLNRDERELPMATKALELWEKFAAETGEDTGFNRCGLFYLSDDEAQIDQWARWHDFGKAAGIPTQLLSSREATERGRMTGRAWKGGIISSSDGTADPSKAAPAVASALIKLGGTVLQNCAARGVELEGGRVSGVVTEIGVIKTRTVVLAGGAWASSFCRQLGISFPLSTLRQSILRVTTQAQALPRALASPKVSVTRRGDGSYGLAISGRGRVDPTLQLLRYAPKFIPMFAKRWRNVSPGGLQGLYSGHETLKKWRLDETTPMERMRILDPRPDARTIRKTYDRATQLLPALRDARIVDSWAGYVDCTYDGVPAIGEVAEVPGLVLAAGFSGHGFGVGPGAGFLLAEMITGDKPYIDPTPLSPQRFSQSAWGKVAEF